MRVAPTSWLLVPWIGVLAHGLTRAWALSALALVAWLLLLPVADWPRAAAAPASWRATAALCCIYALVRVQLRADDGRHVVVGR